MSDMTLGEPIPPELLEGISPVTPGGLRVMRFVLLPVFVLFSAVSLALADLERGPGLQTAAATTSAVLCIVAAILGRERVHRRQRLALRRLQKGQRPTGTTRRPSSRVGAVKMILIGLALLLVGYPVALASNSTLPWPSTALAVFFAFAAGGFTARVPVWIRERRWPSPDGAGA